jgi:hypothetical protein
MAAMIAAPPASVADPARLRRVLLVKLSSLGDIVHALPLAQSLRAALPDAHLAWAVRAKFADLLRDCPYMNAVHTLDGTRARDLVAFGKMLRASGPAASTPRSTPRDCSCPASSRGCRARRCGSAWIATAKATNFS